MFQGATFLVALGLLPGAGSARPLLAAVVATGATVAALRLVPGLGGRSGLSFGTAWTVLAAPIVGAETMGVLGTPGPRGILALAFVWSVFAAVCLGLWRRIVQRGRRVVTLAMHVSVLVGGVATALWIAEVALREVMPPQPYTVVPDEGSPEKLFRRDERVVLRMNEGFRGRFVHPEFLGQRVEINESGYRDRPWTDEGLARIEGRRILLLGDSFVFGTGVEIEDQMGRVIERMTASHPGGVHVFNGGVPGYCPVNEAIVLAELADRLAPDVVAMAMYVGNDLMDAADWLFPQDFDEHRAMPETAAVDERIHADLLLRRAFSVDYWYWNARVGGVLLGYVVPPLVRLGVLHPVMNCNDFELRASALEPDPRAVAALEACQKGIADAAELCRARGMRFVVVLVPSIALVDVSMFERVLDLRPLPRDRFSPDVLHDRVRRFAETRDISVCDLLPESRRRFEGGELLYHQEGHWNPAGHRLAAELLVAHLEENGWL